MNIFYAKICKVQIMRRKKGVDLGQSYPHLKFDCFFLSYDDDNSDNDDGFIFSEHF